jgi:YHS domain-containing protein
MKYTKRYAILSLFAVTLGIGAFVLAEDSSSAPPAATQPSVAVTDMRNTICPVSGDKVGNSDEDEMYDGKVYHLCCPDCHKDFEKDPAKYAAAVAANPAKYGITK